MDNKDNSALAGLTISETDFRCVAEAHGVSIETVKAIFREHADFAQSYLAAQAEQSQSAGSARQGGDTSLEGLTRGFDYEAGLDIKAVLYTDTINDKQVCRDDLWLATTAALNALSGVSSAAIASQSQAAQPTADSVRESVRDAVAQALTGIYHCGRAWSAWGYGTMREDDFTPAAEVDDVLSEITDAAIAAHIAGTSQATKAQAELLKRIIHERDALAQAITDAALKAGIASPDACLTGPHLIMMCNDMAECALAAPVAKEAPATPEGFTLVPLVPTREMQDAYFKVIDKNMQRVRTDPRFGRWDNMRVAYTAMLAAAPVAPTTQQAAKAESDQPKYTIAESHAHGATMYELGYQKGRASVAKEAPTVPEAVIAKWMSLRGNVVTCAINGTAVYFPPEDANDVLDVFDAALPDRSDDEDGEPAAQKVTQQAAPEAPTYQIREIGEGDWESVSKERMESVRNDAHWDYRIVEPAATQQAAKGESEQAVPEGLRKALDELRVVLQMATPSIDQIHEHGPDSEIEKAWQIFYDDVMPALAAAPGAMEQAHVMPPFEAPAGQHGDGLYSVELSDADKSALLSIVGELEWSVNGTWVITKSGEQIHVLDALAFARTTRAFIDRTPTTSTVSAPAQAEVYLAAELEPATPVYKVEDVKAGAQAAPEDVMADFEKKLAFACTECGLSDSTYEALCLVLRTSTDQANADTGSAE